MRSGRRAGRIVVFFFALALSAVGVTCAGGPPGPESDPDARIAFHRARIDGAGTYPHHARLGLAYLTRAREGGSPRDLVRAERHLRRSLSFQPNYEALVGLATFESMRHRFREALAFAEEAAAAAPESLEARGLLSEIHLALGDLARAAKETERMFAAGPSFEAHARRSAVEVYRGDFPAALAAMERACEAAQASRRWAGTRAWCAARRGELVLLAQCDVAGAESSYHESLELMPGYFLAREHLAELRAIQGRYEEAWSLYRGLLRERDEAGYRLALADLAERLKRPDRAHRERDRALAIWRRDERRGSLAHAHEYVLALLERDEPEAIAEALEIAQAEWSGRRDGLTADALARAYRRAGMRTEAVAVVDQALESGARDPGLVEVAVELLRASGRVEEADRLEADRALCHHAPQEPAAL